MAIANAQAFQKGRKEADELREKLWLSGREYVLHIECPRFKLQ